MWTMCQLFCVLPKPAMQRVCYIVMADISDVNKDWTLKATTND